MTLSQRRLLYIFFILLFIVITPLISLYAAGYSINKNFSIKKTGILIIDTEPRGAKIYLDGKIQQAFLNKFLAKNQNYIKTPAKIKNLRPGEYDISLELDNYWTWQKKLTIKPGESTFAEDVYLFKNDLPIILTEGMFNRTTISPNKNYLAAFATNKAVVINLNNEKTNTYNPPATGFNASTSTGIEWSPSGEKLIFSQFVFNTNEWSAPINLKSIIGQQKNIKWGDDDNKIFYASGNGIYQYNLNTKINSTIIKNENINNFFLKNNYLYYIKQSGHATELNVFSLEEKNNIKKIKLPYSSYNFLNPNHKLINLYDNSYNILYLVDPFSDIRPLREAINNINKTLWIDENKLLFANDYEIWTFDLNNYKKNLLTRISSKINKIIWHPNNNYVIYGINNSINTIELDDREKHNITSLTKLDIINNLHINKTGDTLYFYSQIRSQKGIYKLSIQ